MVGKEFGPTIPWQDQNESCIEYLSTLAHSSSQHDAMAILKVKGLSMLDVTHATHLLDTVFVRLDRSRTMEHDKEKLSEVSLKNTTGKYKKSKEFRPLDNLEEKQLATLKPLRNFRNDFLHCGKFSLSDAEYDVFYSRIFNILQKLGMKKLEIKNFKDDIEKTLVS